MPLHRSPRADFEKDLRESGILQWILARQRRAAGARSDAGGKRPGPRLPDYWQFTVNGGTVVGGTVEFIVDRYGRVYISPGANIGKSSTFLSASLVGGWLNQSRKPDAERLRKYITGLSIGVGGGFVLGGNRVWGMPGVGKEAGFFTPQVGLTGTYGFQTPLPGFKW